MAVVVAKVTVNSYSYAFIQIQPLFHPKVIILFEELIRLYTNN